jgi:predicted  nucleic acid-binding Zn-ribbon protein
MLDISHNIYSYSCDLLCFSSDKKIIIIRKTAVINKKNRSIITLITGRVFPGFAVYICTLLLGACTSINISPDVNALEQAKAENRVMKQNITLAVRENSILKEENIQYKSETGKLKAKVKLLESEIQSLNKKHEQDIALFDEKYENLNKQNQILSQESSTKIRELADTNKEIEERMTKEITRLSGNIRDQEEKFNNERAGIETAFSAKEQEYQKQLAQLKKDILSGVMEIESLKSKLTESEAYLKSAKAALNKQLDLNRELKNKIDSVNGSAGVKQEASRKKDTGTP